MKKLELAMQRSWETNAEAWTQSVRKGVIESRKIATDEAILKVILSHSPKIVLDMGCGEGWLTRALTNEGVISIGLDGSEQLINNARLLNDGIFRQLKYEEFIKNSEDVGRDFNVIVFNFSILSEDISSLLNACRQALLPGGRLIIQTVHPVTTMEMNYKNGWREEEFSSMGEGFKSSMPWYFRTLGTWVEELRNCGFELLECIEPLNPNSNKPLSLILVSCAA